MIISWVCGCRYLCCRCVGVGTYVAGVWVLELMLECVGVGAYVGVCGCR